MNAVVNHQPISYKRAREIMGSNFFSAEEAIKCLGANPSRAALTALAEVPFLEEVLESCRDTHILIAELPVSISFIRDKVERNLFYSHENAWYNKQAFAEDKGKVGWQLICKTIAEDSLSRSLKEQQVFLSKDDKTPSAKVMIYTIIGHFKNTGERLFEHTYVRTSTVVSGGRRVDVGRFNKNGLDVYYWWDYYRCDVVGLSSAKVPMLKS
ncbi:hypothetical protein IIC45_00265 [Patescibacteria group bacterium]|nr:hypothetical protein [Patescibacteria group bacterium]